MGMGFQFEQHRLGLWDLSWDLKKNNLLGNGIRTPPSGPSTNSSHLFEAQKIWKFSRLAVENVRDNVN